MKRILIILFLLTIASLLVIGCVPIGESGKNYDYVSANETNCSTQGVNYHIQESNTNPIILTLNSL